MTTDASDVYEEKIEGDNYLFKNEWKPLWFRREIIKVKGQSEPVIITIRHTHHGPVIDYFNEDLGKVLYSAAPVFPDGTYSLAWTGHKYHDNSVEK